MAIVKPFAALRPVADLAQRLCELPYDVVSSSEARQLAAGNPLSFFHVSKPEIDLDENVGPYDDRVYAQGLANLKKLVTTGALERQPPAVLYRSQKMGAHQQFGIVAVTDCEEYPQRPNQKTRTHPS